ncbi:hypothetical protein [Marinifilum flexuosum]|uniref:Uncharacterized protein n=1 Tax=Marinifilum flexuosum TaxID=1117708 RepID=A0A419XB93_9BACT|nr:hypothetical protein [Marinifilum flexuosum]RKE04982.1 hypothetical protein BXY64_2013 [Marinifilum flexuosum]
MQSKKTTYSVLTLIIAILTIFASYHIGNKASKTSYNIAEKSGVFKKAEIDLALGLWKIKSDTINNIVVGLPYNSKQIYMGAIPFSIINNGDESVSSLQVTYTYPEYTLKLYKLDSISELRHNTMINIKRKYTHIPPFEYSSFLFSKLYSKSKIVSSDLIEFSFTSTDIYTKSKGDEMIVFINNEATEEKNIKGENLHIRKRINCIRNFDVDISGDNIKSEKYQFSYTAYKAKNLSDLFEQLIISYKYDTTNLQYYGSTLICVPYLKRKNYYTMKDDSIFHAFFDEKTKTAKLLNSSNEILLEKEL